MRKNEITIIMPAYNSENTIEKSIKSVVDQNNDNWKLIIIDDNSTDNTRKICKEYEKKYLEKIRCIKNTKKGVSSARNLGIELCDTEYIMFLDSDDTFSKDAIQTMNRNVNDCDWVICGYNRIIFNTNRIHKTFDDNSIYNKNNVEELIEKMQDKCLLNQLWNKIYKTNIIKENNIRFNEELDVCEDQLFNLEYLKNIEIIKVIESVLYNYVSNPSGLNLKYIEKRLEKKIMTIEYECDNFFKDKYLSNYIQKIYLYTCFSGIANIVKFKNTSKKELYDFINNKELHNKITIITKNTKKVLFKILGKILNFKSYIVLLMIGKTSIFIKRVYRRIKYE